jgi:hypothetical protein
MYHILRLPTNQSDEIMGINITLNAAETTEREWSALAAFVAVMQTGNAEKIAEGMLDSPAVQTVKAELAEADRARRKLPVTVHVEHTVSSDLAAFGGAILSPADNPSTGIDPDLASFAVPNASGGTVTGASTAAVPVVGAAPSLLPVTPPIPAAPGTVAAPQASLVPLDKNGLPWDSRIHASTKTQNADATWRNKRGVSDEEIARVTAELRQVMAIPAPPAPPVPGAPPPPPGVPAAPAGPMTFIKLMPKVTAALTSGQITKEHVDAVLQRFGFPHLPALAPRADLVPQVHDAIFGVQS